VACRFRRRGLLLLGLGRPALLAAAPRQTGVGHRVGGGWGGARTVEAYAGPGPLGNAPGLLGGFRFRPEGVRIRFLVGILLPPIALRRLGGVRRLVTALVGRGVPV